MKRTILDKRRRRLAADRNGAVAAEFALLLPLLSLFVFSTFQYGVLFYSYNTMLNAARNGARSLAVGSATEAEVKATIKASLPGWIPQDKWEITPKNAKTTGTNFVTTQIAVPARYATFLNFGPMPETLDALIVMETES